MQDSSGVTKAQGFYFFNEPVQYDLMFAWINRFRDNESQRQTTSEEEWEPQVKLASTTVIFFYYNVEISRKLNKNGDAYGLDE